MLKLRTLGATHVVDADGDPLTGAAAQRRTLALLTLLSVAGSAGLSRDKLVGLLWPDAEPERARHSLTQGLYAARRALGVDDLFVIGGDVRLNRDHLASDVQAFEAALDAGDLDQAVALYQGPFLDGFYLPGSVDFEQWAAAQRARLETRAAEALERLADQAMDAGDARRAVEWRRRVAAMQPLDASATVKLMRALAQAGDRAGALQQARVHEVLLREQLDLAPDQVVVALAEGLRESAEWNPNGPEIAVATSEELRAATDVEAVAMPNAGEGGPVALRGPVADDVAPQTPTRVAARWGRRPMAALAALAVVLALVLVLLLRSRSDAPETRLLVKQQVVVAPFRVAGANPALAYLRDGMVELLSARLADDSAARSVDAGAVLGAWETAGLRGTIDVPRDTIVRLAARLGAERVVIGSVVGTPTRAVIGATVLMVPSGAVSGEATVEGPVDSLTTLVDRLAARLLTSEAGEDERLESQTTPSLRALRAYLDGQAAYRGTSYAAALRHYERALAADTTFALAGLQIALAASNLNDAAQVGRGVAAAWPFREALSERDLTQLVAFAGPRYPGASPAREQVAAWERVVELAPNRTEAWYQLGMRLAHLGAAAGLPGARERGMSALQRARALDPDDVQARQLLVELAAVDSGTVLAALTADSLGPLAPLARWRVAVARGDATGRRRVRDSIPLLGPATLRAMALTSLFDGIALDDGALAVRALRARAARPAERVDAALAEHAFALVQGRPRAALDAATQLRDLQPGAQAHLRLRVLDALYGEGDSVAAESSVRDLAAVSDAGGAATPTVAARQLANLCVVAQWRLARGDTTGVRAAVARLRAPVTPPGPLAVSASPRTCAELVDVALAVATRRRDAIARVHRLDSLLLAGPATGDASAYAPLFLARLHERLGDLPGALEAIRRRSYMIAWPHYLATAWREEGALAERVGEVAGARTAYARYLGLRESPEDAVAPRVEEVRRLVERMDGGAATR